jgi:hypothetical protein
MSPRHPEMNQEHRHPNQKGKNYTNIKKVIKGKCTSQQKETDRIKDIINKKNTNQQRKRSQ